MLQRGRLLPAHLLVPLYEILLEKSSEPVAELMPKFLRPIP